jgi:hypothetical protein
MRMVVELAAREGPLETQFEHARTACPICSRLGEYIEIDNPQDGADADESESFPPEVEHLQVPNEALERYYRYKSERLLKCAHCGTYYWYRTWAPGGSEDVMRTYIHESIRRLSFLEAHVKLHDALYQSCQTARERGGEDVAAYPAIQASIEGEMALLRVRCGEVVRDAVYSLEHKHHRSEEVAEELRLYYPHLDHPREIARVRAREEEVAAYHAGILAEYLTYWAPGEIPGGLIERLVDLLADDNPHVRGALLEALLRTLDAAGGEMEMACHMAQVLEQLEARSAEAEALLAACREVGRKAASGSPA